MGACPQTPLAPRAFGDRFSCASCAPGLCVPRRKNHATPLPAAFGHYMYPTPACAYENITRDHRTRLVSSNRERSPYYKHIFSTFLTFFKFLVCIHPGNARVPPRVLASGPKPCGGNYFTPF